MANWDVEEATREAAEEAEAQLKALLEKERKIRELCMPLHNCADFQGALLAIVHSLQDFTNCDSVGIRLKDGMDYPYFVQAGYSEDFLQLEGSLTKRKCTTDGCKGCCGNSHAELIRGGHCSDKPEPALQFSGLEVEDCGSIKELDCLCGDVIRSLYDPSLAAFNRAGTFFVADTKLLETDQLHFGCALRGICIQKGYRTMAMAPIRTAGEVVGLIQANDRVPNKISTDTVAAIETVAATIGAALGRALRAHTLPASLAQSLAHLERIPGHSPILQLIPGPLLPQLPGSASSEIADVLGKLNMDQYVTIFQDANLEKVQQLATSSADQLVTALGISPLSASKVMADVGRRAAQALNISDVAIDVQIGHGEFATVWRGRWQNTPVAVKQVHSVTYSRGLLREAAVLSRLSHPNVIHLFGVTKVSELPAIVTELAEGSLLEMLRSELIARDSARLVCFAEMAAAGLQYVNERGVLHRDLACRNLLYTTDESGGVVVKIADFGLAHIVDPAERDKGVHSTAPVRWSAIETLTLGVATVASDAWSFGVVLWEIFTLGAVPYESVEKSAVLPFLLAGGRLEPPAGCPEVVAKMMRALWHENPQARPRIRRVHRRLVELRDGLHRASHADSLHGSDTPTSQSQATPKKDSGAQSHSKCALL